MNLQPLGDRLIVEVLDEEETTVSGIVLPDTAWQGAMAFAERLRRNVDEHTFGGDELLEITIYVGVAHARGTDSLTAEDLLEQADRNLYKAKDGGRTYVSVDPLPERRRTKGAAMTDQPGTTDAVVAVLADLVDDEHRRDEPYRRALAAMYSRLAATLKQFTGGDAAQKGGSPPP